MLQHTRRDNQSRLCVNLYRELTPIRGSQKSREGQTVARQETDCCRLEDRALQVREQDVAGPKKDVAGPQNIANLRQRTSSKAKSRRRSVVKRRPATE